MTSHPTTKEHVKYIHGRMESIHGRMESKISKKLVLKFWISND